MCGVVFPVGVAAPAPEAPCSAHCPRDRGKLLPEARALLPLPLPGHILRRMWCWTGCPAAGPSLPWVSVMRDSQRPHQPDGLLTATPPTGLSLSRPAQGSPRPQEHGQVPRCFLPSLEVLMEVCLSGTPRPPHPASPTHWSGTPIPIPMKSSCGAEAWGLSLATQEAELEAGISLQALPEGHQCLRTREGPCTPHPCPALQPFASPSRGAACHLCVRKITAAGWRTDWMQTEAIRAGEGRGGRRKTGFPSPGASLLLWAGLTHWAWPLARLAEPRAQLSLHSVLPTLPPLAPYTVSGVLGGQNVPTREERHTLSLLLKWWDERRMG